MTRSQRQRMVEDALVWVRPEVLVDYHSVIGGPVTQGGLVVRAGPVRDAAGQWVCWLTGKSGSVAVEALTAAG